MVYAKVHCYHCGADYHIYSYPLFAEKVNSCPHCCATMPDKAYKKLGNALMTFEEVNKDLRVAHDDRGEPLFQIELRNHYVPQDVFNSSD